MKVYGYQIKKSNRIFMWALYIKHGHSWTFICMRWIFCRKELKATQKMMKN